MKKKTMAFGGLLAAVAMTGYSVAGTYAKYVSSIDLTDEARVAKWGFNEDMSINLFKSSYTTADGKYVQAFQTLNDDGSLKTDATGNAVYDNVVAPGTTGTSTVALEGEMETRFILSFNLLNANDFVVYYSTDANGNVDKMDTTKAGLIAKGVAEADVKEYRPLRYTIEYNKFEGEGADRAAVPVTTTVDGKTVTINSLLTNVDINTLKARLDLYNANNWTDATKTKYNLAHTFTPQALDREIKITWTWATNNTIDNTINKNTLDKDNSNKLDTFAGQNLSKHSDIMTFGMNVTAEQVAEDFAN